MDQLVRSEVVAHLGGPLDRRLALRSLAMALRPGFEVAVAGDKLAALAGGNRTALLRAIARTNGRVEARSGPASQRAGAALRWALAMIDGRDVAEFLTELQDQLIDTFAGMYRAMANCDRGAPHDSTSSE